MAALFDGGGFYQSGGGALPWGASAGGVIGAGNNRGALAANYQNAYNQSLAQNQSNYNNIFSGYQGALASQQAAQKSLAGGYSQLYGDVLGKIQTQGDSRNQAIADQYRASSGQMNQTMIDRGLGNTTVTSAVQRGNNLDQAKAYNQNTEQIAGLQAGYMSQLGLAGLKNQQDSYMANTGLLNRQLDFMNSVQAHYPDAGLYAQLAESNSGNRGAGNQGRGTFGGGGGGTPGLGYAPRAAPGYYPSGDAPSYGSGSGGFGAWAGTPFGSSGGSPYSDPFTGAGNYAGATGTGSGGDYGGGGGGGWMGALASNYGGGGGGATLNDFYDAGGF